MTNPTDPSGTSRISPEDVASRAGLPRQDEIRHSVHGVGDQSGPTADSTASLRSKADDARGRVGATASAVASEAADRTADIRSTVAEVTDTAQAQVAGAYETARSWASERYDEHSRRAADLADRGYVRLHRGRTATEAFVSDNPLLVGVVGLAAGLLLGALLPRTRREEEAIGPWADEMRDHGLRYAREMTHRGRAFVESALDPDNLERAARDAGISPEGMDERSYEGSERTAHRL